QPNGYGPAASTPPTARRMQPPGSSSPTPATTRSGLAGWTMPVPWRISPGCCSPPRRTVPPFFTASRLPASCEQDQHQQQGAENDQAFARLRAHGHHPWRAVVLAAKDESRAEALAHPARPVGPAHRAIGGYSLTRHPETHLIEVVCATCSTAFTVRSAAASLPIDVCSSCHPA